MSDPNADPAQQELLERLREMLALQTNELSGLLDKRLDEFGSGLSEFHALVRTRLEHLEAGVRTRFEHFEAGQIKVRAEIMDRIDRLQETVELVREDSRVNWATADTAMNRVRNSREDIENLTLRTCWR